MHGNFYTPNIEDEHIWVHNPVCNSNSIILGPITCCRHIEDCPDNINVDSPA